MDAVSPEVAAFFAAEALSVHAACDKALVPRKVNGELLSMAQRAEMLATAYRSACEALAR